MKGDTLNDQDRRDWINNYEPLYLWQRHSGQPMSQFIRTNRADIDKAIRMVRDAPPRRIGG